MNEKKSGFSIVKVALGVCLGLLLFLGSCLVMFGKAAADARAQTEAPTRVSFDEFERIRTGMTRDEVAKVIESPGTETSRTDIAGAQTVMVRWDGNALGASVSGTFQNGRLINKVQIGLK